MASKAQRAVTDVPAGRWAELGSVLQEWREDMLGYQARRRFADDRDINIRLVQDLEKNYRPGTYTKFALQGAAQAYRVTYESLLAFLRGSADKLYPVQDAAPDEPALADPLALPPSPFGDLARDAADRPYALAIWKQYLGLPKNVTDPSGAQMFPGDPGDAKAWDSISGLPLGDRVWVIADMRRRADGRAQGHGTGTAGALTSQLVRSSAAYVTDVHDSRHGYRIHLA